MDLVFASPADFRRTITGTVAAIVLGMVVGVSGIRLEVFGAGAPQPPGPAAHESIASTARVEPAARLATTRTVGDYTVTLLDVHRTASETTVRYGVTSANPTFDMVLSVRAVNPDGTIVFPIRSADPGTVRVYPDGTTEQFGGEPADTFANSDLQPGAVVQFGPFLGADATPVLFAATGAELRAGNTTSIAGDEFRVTMETGDVEGIGETANITLTNVSVQGQIQIDWLPGTQLAWFLNGEPVEPFKGGSGFTKTPDYNANVSRAQAIFARAIGDDDVIEVRAAGVGRLTKGDWSFPLD